MLEDTSSAACTLVNNQTFLQRYTMHKLQVAVLPIGREQPLGFCEPTLGQPPRKEHLWLRRQLEGLQKRPVMSQV